MNDDRLVILFGDFELSDKKLRLHALVAELLVVIETAFTDGDHVRELKPVFDGLNPVFARISDFDRSDTNGMVHPRNCFDIRVDFFEVVETVINAYNARDPGLLCLLNNA